MSTMRIIIFMRSRNGKRFVFRHMNTYENFQNFGRWFCGKYTKGNFFEVLDTILKIAGMIVTVISTIVKAIDLVDRLRHQKSNRPTKE